MSEHGAEIGIQKSETPEPPKVIHVITRLVVGGAQENTILTCRGLHQRGFDVTLVTGPETGPEGSLLDDARADGYRVLVFKSLRRNPRPILDLVALISLWRFFRRERPDIVHTHSSKAGILGRMAARLAGVPVIIHTNHGLPFHPRQNRLVRGFWKFLERRVAPATRKFICVGETMKRASIEAGLAPPERHEVVYSGMEIPPVSHYASSRADLRPRFGILDSEPVIAWVGRLVAQKGPRDFLEVLDIVMSRDGKVKARIVGDGPLRAGLESAVAAKPWGDRVVFTGRVAPEIVSSYLSVADVAVLTSYWEGLPRVAVQAALAGLPVVAYDVEGASEVVSSGKTGFLVEVGDKRSLADRVIDLLLMPDRGRAMGKRGREFVGDRFEAKRMIDALERVYRELL